MSNKDIKKIEKKVNKITKDYCDEGTYKRWVNENNHTKIEGKYNGKHFIHTFPSSPRDKRVIRQCKNQIKNTFRDIGFPMPDDFLTLVVTCSDKERRLQELVEEVWYLLEEDDED